MPSIETQVIIVLLAIFSSLCCVAFAIYVLVHTYRKRHAIAMRLPCDV